MISDEFGQICHGKCWNGFGPVSSAASDIPRAIDSSGARSSDQQCPSYVKDPPRQRRLMTFDFASGNDLPTSGFDLTGPIATPQRTSWPQAGMWRGCLGAMKFLVRVRG